MTTQSFDGNGRLTNEQVTEGSVNQLAINDDGSTTTYTVGDDTLSLPDSLGTSSGATVTPDVIGYAPTAQYVVTKGTYFGWWANVFSSDPTGAYTQPWGAGSGFESANADGSYSSTVVLDGVGAGGPCCNTITPSTTGNPNSGTIYINIVNGAPNTQYEVDYTVSGTATVTASDPDNPSLGGAPALSQQWGWNQRA